MPSLRAAPQTLAGRGGHYFSGPTHAMHAYLTEPGLLAGHQRRATLAFEKFRMKYCLAAYKDIFSAAQQQL